MTELKQLSPVLMESEGVYYIVCPGCRGMGHMLNTVQNGGPCWTFSGNIEKPSFSPSLVVHLGDGKICHSFIKDGQIQYLNDCYHDMAGTTVDLLSWDD